MKAATKKGLEVIWTPTATATTPTTHAINLYRKEEGSTDVRPESIAVHFTEQIGGCNGELLQEKLQPRLAET